MEGKGLAAENDLRPPCPDTYRGKQVPAGGQLHRTPGLPYLLPRPSPFWAFLQLQYLKHVPELSGVDAGLHGGSSSLMGGSVSFSWVSFRRNTGLS